MRNYYYELVEMITEMITGTINGHIKLWELEEYLRTSAIVKDCLNGFCALFLVLIITLVWMMIKEYRNEKLSKVEA